MKKIFIILIFTLLYNLGSAQNLTINDLFVMCKKNNWSEVNDYLFNKKWVYYNSVKGDNEHYDIISWSFNKDEYYETAQGWVHLYTYEALPNKISYTFSSNTTYASIKNGIQALGMKVVDKKIEDNSISVKYSSQNFIVEISTEKRDRKEGYNEGSSIVAYEVTAIVSSSIYDKDNGVKDVYDDDGNLQAKVTLKNGEMNGPMIVYHPNGNVKSKYTISNSEKEGFATDYYESGVKESEYYYKKGNIDGVIKIYHENGKLQEVSNMLNAKRNGIVKLFNEDGTLSSEYTYLNDKKNGPFKEYENGKIINTGNMIDDMKDGLFITYDENQNIVSKAIYKEDKLNGKVLMYFFENGLCNRRYEADFVNEKKNGIAKQFYIIDKKEILASTFTYVNDLKDGPYMRIKNDSIFYGNYSNDLLDGKHKLYINVKTNILGTINNGDTTNAKLTQIGEYKNGQKSGFWQYFDLAGAKESEGEYYYDEMNGTWNFYYSNYLEDFRKSGLTSYSGKLYKKATYQNDKLNGKQERYSNLEVVNVLCDTAKYKNRSPLDSCSKTIFTNFKETSYYKDGILNGYCEILDSNGVLKLKGNFVNGIKEGNWTIGKSYYKFMQLENFYCYYEGNIKDNKKQGTWQVYMKTGEKKDIFETLNYKDDQLDGLIEMHSGTKITMARDYVKQIQVFDSTKTNLIENYHILSETSDIVRFLKFTYNPNNKIEQEYKIKIKPTNSIIDYDLMLNYLGIYNYQALADIKMPELIKDGKYAEYDKTDKITLEGYFTNDLKSGDWKNYYYDQNIYSVQPFANNNGATIEYFEIDTDKPYSGKLIFKHNNGKVKSEYKISKGLLDGKSKYYDEKGDLIKTEKYNQGDLVLDN
jgi:antitoxin component YwqK of YwqJK toxin-antitoxin module